MKEVIKVKLIYGEPKIARAEIIDGYFVVDILLVGIDNDCIEVVADDEYLSVELLKSSVYTTKFKVEFYAGIADWREFDFNKENGILTLKVPVLTEEDLDLEPIRILI